MTPLRPVSAAYRYSARAEGTECTIDGESPAICVNGTALVCVPRRQSTRSADALPDHEREDAQKIKDEAYQAMCAEMTRGRSNG